MKKNFLNLMILLTCVCIFNMQAMEQTSDLYRKEVNWHAQTLYGAIHFENDNSIALGLIEKYMNAEVKPEERINPNTLVSMPPYETRFSFLQWATCQKNREVIEALIEHGAWPNWRGESGELPYSKSKRNGAKEAEALLRLYDTLLRFMRDNVDDIAIVEKLVAEGLCPYAHMFDDQNQCGISIIEMARKKELFKVAGYLKELNQEKIKTLRTEYIQKNSCPCM